jgi:hypothetical protein
MQALKLQKQAEDEKIATKDALAEERGKSQVQRPYSFQFLFLSNSSCVNLIKKLMAAITGTV